MARVDRLPTGRLADTMIATVIARSAAFETASARSVEGRLDGYCEAV